RQDRYKGASSCTNAIFDAGMKNVPDFLSNKFFIAGENIQSILSFETIYIIVYKIILIIHCKIPLSEVL
ncbi:MAG: hypothetical protein N5837_03950, partial [Lactobacillus crispatus]|nr:hypothetical protein [Lactobacillus crispatus]